MKQVLVLGSTGSIGLSTLDVLERNSGSYSVWGLTANSNYQKIIKQLEQFSPKYVALSDCEAAEEVRSYIQTNQLDIELLAGPDSLVELASRHELDIVMAGIVGAAGLPATYAAIKNGKKVLLANKESLVCAGGLFMQAVQDFSAQIMPVDSEHNAIYQCLPNGQVDKSVSKILLTASGGPFRGWGIEQLKSVTPEQAVAHPNWSMGQKISVDSATMMNKGLELIEACWLFDIKPEQIHIVLHPQSVIHSMVHYCDGSVLAQMGNPDMRTPIAHALAWPERVESGVNALDFSQLSLDFELPNLDSYPCLKIALDVAQEMGAAPAVMNAANEIAVDAFLTNKISFLSIAELVSKTLNKLSFVEPDCIDDVISIDTEARAYAQQLVKNF